MPETIIVSDADAGTEIKWGRVDSSKVVSAIRWVGFAIERDTWTSTGPGGVSQPSHEQQNFTSYESKGDQTFGYAAIRENIPADMITGKQVASTLYATSGQGAPSYQSASLPWVGASGTGTPALRALVFGAPGTIRVDGVRINAKLVGSVFPTIRVSRNGLPANYVIFSGRNSYTPLKNGDNFYWFSSPLFYDPTNSEAVVVEVTVTGFAGSVEITGFEVFKLDTDLLDVAASARYRYPAPDSAVIEIDGRIVKPEQLVQMTFRGGDDQTKTVTRAAQSFEHQISKDGYPKTIIRAGQARDATETAIWAEIRARDRRATVNAVAFSPRGKG